jgi:hypothetical protein
MAKFKGKNVPPKSAESKVAPAESEESRREDTMPSMQPTQTTADSLYEAAAKFTDAIVDTHCEAQKRYRAAWRNYFQALRAAIDPSAVQEATRAYAADVQKSFSNQDSREYLEATSRLATVALQAQEAASARMKDAYTRWSSEWQEAFTRAAAAQKAEFEKYLNALQTAFSEVDPSTMDALTLAKLGQATLSAAALRTQFGS